MTTAADIATFARNVLQTDSTDLPDSLVLAFANDATRRILGMHNDWPHMYSEGTLAVVAGTSAYTLASASFNPQTFIYLESMWDDNGFGMSLQEIDYQEATRWWIGAGFTSSNMPSWFAQYGGKVYIYPKPSGTRTFRVGGYRDVVDMANMSATPDLPSQFHIAVEYGVTSLAHAQSEDFEAAQFWAGLANATAKIAAQQVFNTTTHRPAQMFGRGGPRFMISYPDWVRSQVP